MHGELQRIVVLCFVAVATVGVYLFVVQERAEAPVQDETTQTQIDPPSLELDTGPEDTNVDNASPETNNLNALPAADGRPVEVYDGITIGNAATSLDLSGRRLEGSLKAEIRLLSNLETLDLSNNRFTGLPAEVGQLSKLKELNLANNELTGLPRELGNLQNLEILDLRGNNPSPEDLAIIREALPAGTQILE